MNKTVTATPRHNNKAIISLNDQTNIQGPFAWAKSTCIDQNTGCLIKQLCTQGTWFYVRNSECTGFGIHRVILYVTSGKIPSTKQFVRIKENLGTYKIWNRQITLYIFVYASNFFRWMTCLISFVWALPSCEEQKARNKSNANVAKYPRRVNLRGK